MQPILDDLLKLYKPVKGSHFIYGSLTFDPEFMRFETQNLIGTTKSFIVVLRCVFKWLDYDVEVYAGDRFYSYAKNLGDTRDLEHIANIVYAAFCESDHDMLLTFDLLEVRGLYGKLPKDQ